MQEQVTCGWLRLVCLFVLELSLRVQGNMQDQISKFIWRFEPFVPLESTAGVSLLPAAGRLPEGVQREPDPGTELCSVWGLRPQRSPGCRICQFAHRCRQILTLILDAKTVPGF